MDSGYRYWVTMSGPGIPSAIKPLSNSQKILGLGLLLFIVLGCSSAGSRKSGKDLSDGGSAAGLSRLQFAESQQNSALYELVYSNAGSKEISDVRYAQGRLLMNEKGVFRFEQAKKEPQRNLIIYFHPDREIVVIFPKLKTAVKATPDIISGDEGDRLLAAYDGLRMVLCMSNVWNNPEKNSLEITSMGDSLSLQEEGRSFRWIVDMDSGVSGNPITSMRARKGFRNLCSIERKSNSIQQYSRANKDAFMQGGAGQLSKTNEWSLVIPGHVRQSDFSFTPYPIRKSEPENIDAMFEPPEIDPSIQVQQLTLDLIRDWMGLR